MPSLNLIRSLGTHVEDLATVALECEQPPRVNKVSIETRGLGPGRLLLILSTDEHDIANAARAAKRLNRWGAVRG